MASKFGLAGGIPERRVRSVWDAIDSRQFKSALKHVSSLLAKYPNSPYALALKALILERMGKAEEALSVCLNAKELLYSIDTILIDDLTLSTMQIVFQRLDRLDLATGCYEYACGKFPNHSDLLMGLFNCYVREYSFVKQQQTAIKMYKHSGEERFLLWAVCSIQLQVLCGDGEEKLLLLAEGLLKKHVASHGLHEPEALMMYISILERQAKYGDSLEILSGKLGSLLTIEADKLRIKGRLLARAGDYNDAAETFQRILEICPDDWECFLHYLGCLLEDDCNWDDRAVNEPLHLPKYLQSKILHISDEVFDSRMSNALAFVQKLQADNSNIFLRCPYLANLEIERRKQAHGRGDDDRIMEALMQYFLRFGHLACFTSDVEIFLDVLTPDKKAELLKKLKENTDSFSKSPNKVLGQSISLYKLQEVVGNTFQLPLQELGSCAAEMADMYCKNLPLSKDLDPQESMYGEDLLSLVGNLLVQLFWRTRHVGYLVEAIMILEFGLTIRRSVWQYKVLLIHIYSHLGVLSVAYEWYKSLDVKNILMETVSHHILPQMLVSPLWEDLNILLRDYLKFMDDHFRESADLTFLAYHHRNYSKVIEFVQFKERLQQSYQYLLSKLEDSILQLKRHSNIIEEEEGVLESLKCGIHFIELIDDLGSKSLTLNEDLQSRPWWTPTPEKNYLFYPFEGVSFYPREKLGQEREINARRVIQRKSLLPRMIYLSIRSVAAYAMDNIDLKGSISSPKIFSDLEVLLERLAESMGFSLNEAIKVIVGVSSGLKSSEDLGSDLIDWLNLAVFYNAWNLNSKKMTNQNGDGSQYYTWHTVDSLLEKLILKVIRSKESLISFPGSDLSGLVQVVTGPLAWHGLLLQSYVRSSLPSMKKKKKTVTADASPMTVELQDSIHFLCGIVEEVVEWLRLHVKASDEENVESILSSVPNKELDEKGPGKVLQILETFMSSMNSSHIGDHTAEALKSWTCVDVVRKIVNGKRLELCKFLKICDDKLVGMKRLKQQVAQL